MYGQNIKEKSSMVIRYSVQHCQNILVHRYEAEQHNKGIYSFVNKKQNIESYISSLMTITQSSPVIGQMIFPEMTPKVLL